MHIQGKRYRLDTDRKFSSGPSRLSLMMIGLTVGLLWVQFFVAQPLLREVAALRSQMNVYGRRIDQLAATQPGVHRTQSLLAMLEAQGRQAEAAREALNRIAALEQTIQQRAGSAAVTLQSLQRLDELSQQLLAHQQRLNDVAQRLAESPPLPQRAAATQRQADRAPSTATPDSREQLAIGQFRKTVAQLLRDLQSLSTVAKVVHSQAATALQAREIADELARTQRDLKASIDTMKQSADQLGQFAKALAQWDASPERLQAARAAAERLAALEKKLAQQQATLEDADAALDTLIALKDTLRLHRKETGEAKQTAKELVDLARDVAATRETLQTAGAAQQQTDALLQQIAERRTEVAAADHTLDRLLQIHDRLVATTPRLQAAESGLAALQDLQRQVAALGTKLADSLKTLELLGDLDEELRNQVRSIDNVRRDLMEIVLLESAVGRVARILEPLAQLVDLRRLSNADIRAAAEVVLQRRAHRLAQKPRDVTPRTTVAPFRQPSRTAAADPTATPTQAPVVPDPELLETPADTTAAPGGPGEHGERRPGTDAAQGGVGRLDQGERSVRRLPFDTDGPAAVPHVPSNDGYATAASVAEGKPLRTLTTDTPLFGSHEPLALPTLITGRPQDTAAGREASDTSGAVSPALTPADSWIR
ncbi:MAG: hypothetical protein D6725_02420 [Planctomycetota bacterium]|nr:MAG: hypothetical protein D6725_02420 [Planctomycetota bacterium]